LLPDIPDEPAAGDPSFLCYGDIPAGDRRFSMFNNIALMMGDDEPPVDEILSSYIQRMRLQGTTVDFDPVEVAPPDSAGHTGVFGMRQAVIDSHFS